MKIGTIAVGILAALGEPTSRPAPPPPAAIVQALPPALMAEATDLPATTITIAPPATPTAIYAPTANTATDLPHISTTPPIAITPPAWDERPQAQAPAATTPARHVHSEAIRDIEDTIRADRIQLRRDERIEQETGDPLDVRKDVAQLVTDLARLRELQR
jgi:hypothetical protein